MDADDTDLECPSRGFVGVTYPENARVLDRFLYLDTVQIRALEIDFSAKSRYGFLTSLVKFRNWGSNVDMDFYRAISKTWICTVQHGTQSVTHARRAHHAHCSTLSLCAQMAPGGIVVREWSTRVEGL